jgi:hypothetical protein
MREAMMTTPPNAPEAKTTRTDVGYKRPPVEHQFKKGQKPPPRKAKATSAKLSPVEILWQILKECRPVSRKGKRAWISNTELILLKAFELAERGNPTMQRAVTDLLLSLETRKNPLKGRSRVELNGKHAYWLPDYDDPEWGKKENSSK